MSWDIERRRLDDWLKRVRSYRDADRSPNKPLGPFDIMVP